MSSISHRIMSEFFNTFSALNVKSSKFPMGVETMYKVFVLKSFYEKIFGLILSYTLIFFNINLFGKENINILKIGLLAPLSGEYKELGDSLLYSLQLALDEINDRNVFIVPRDSGFNDTKVKFCYTRN